MVRWRWLCSRCLKCGSYCCVCAASLVLLLTATSCLGLNTRILSLAGLTYGDELAADIPLETQGQLLLQDSRRQEPPAPGKRNPHTLTPSHPHTLTNNNPHPHHLNCTTHTTVSVLFFVRLPKCASTSFVDLLQKLSKILNFYLEFNPSGAFNWDEAEMNSVAKQILRKQLVKRNIVYARHFYFVDFRKFGIERFSYVTIIRDPIDRVVSSYLYYHFSSKKHIQRILDPKHRNETLSDCVRQQHEGCVRNLVTKYFCGHEYWCKNGDSKALDTAKKNLANHFAVVGIVEEMELSMRVMGFVLPQYFGMDSGDVLTLPALNKNERMASLSEREREEIATANSADMELYDFAVRLLHDQAFRCSH